MEVLKKKNCLDKSCELYLYIFLQMFILDTDGKVDPGHIL